MSLVLEFLPEAAAELECVTGDYEAKVPGLGVRFRRSIESLCGEILELPLRWRERKAGYRRANLEGFPYYVAFVVREDRILVAAVAHSSRLPDYWTRRIR